MTFKGRGLIQVTGKNNMNQVQTQSVQSLLNNLSLSPTSVLSSGHTGIDWTGINNIHPAVKKYEIYESPEDILALSIAWKRLRDNDKHIVGKLLDKDLFGHVLQVDRTKAVEMRDYYSKKIMMWKLKDKRLTPFREDLNQFIHSDGHIVKENMFGLVYYLPTFYEYDLNLDDIRTKVNYNQQFKKLDNERKPKSLKLSIDLTPIKKINKTTKHRKINQYWLKDTVLNAGVCINVDPNNNLEHIWEYMFNTQNLIKVNGIYTRRTVDDFEYFSLDKWTIDRG